ncbi:hypothetical protein GCM10022393_20220 [Aquimarina addita]|uniref:Signal transduction histidine kinase internal region domain-containing protein n=2 Tax=Aquimarina addita TaxID=870485 RepID=A0ABP6ULL8_9FLAO
MFLCWFVSVLGVSQERVVTIKGSVKEKSTQKPMNNVDIRVLGKRMAQTDAFGDFRIKVSIGDELVISHDSFRTVYYTVKDDQRIDILVEDSPISSGISKDVKRVNEETYVKNLQAAKKSLNKDAAISIEYITKALEAIRDEDSAAEKKKATLYETLADIYLYWNQPDLAIDNYVISIENRFNEQVKIKLGKAYLANKNYQESLQTFTTLQKTQLNSLQKITVFEGLGDSYNGLKEKSKAIKNYNNALSLAEKENQEEAVINLNSKLADVLQDQGSLRKAEEYLGNSVELASRKSKKTSAIQRAKAADFYNKSSSFDKEIQYRKEALEDIEEITEEEENSLSSPSPVLAEDRAITSQVQNYKIANAFAAQSEYDEAIPYLEESIKKAASENDLVVQKDATRKLGEVYREKGELKKASEAFEEYEVIVDKLYIQKEQEISQANLFSRELTKKANRITTLEKDRELNEGRYKLAFQSQELANQQSVKQQIIIYALAGLMILLLLAAYLMYRNMKQQRYANNLLALKSLRSQMNPHFIFNALNSVNTFIATSDERAANKYLTDFSLLMRAVLENSEEDFIPLEKEIELLRLYVKLEHFRFQDKFEYEIIIDPDISISDYMIPPMLLQPYVENAVWHGLRYKSEKGLLSIHINKLTVDSLEIIVRDTGIGREKSKALKTVNQKKQKSQGMSNIQNRISILNKMYKDKVDVFISDLDNNTEGTQVKLILKKSA